MTWFLPATAAAAPPRPIQTEPILGWGDTFTATADLARIPSRAAGLAYVGHDFVSQYLGELEGQMGIDGGLPATAARGGFRGSPSPKANEFRAGRIFYTVETARKSDPRAYPGMPASQEEYDAELGRRVKEQQDELAKTLGQQPDSHWTARVLGGVAEFATRPSTVLSMPLNLLAGPEVGLGRFALGQAAIGGLQGGLDVVDQTGTSALTGNAPPTAGEAALAIAEGAVINAVLGVGLHLLPPAVLKLFQSAKTGAERGAAYVAAKSAATGQAIPPGVSPATGADLIKAGEAALTGEIMPDVSPDAPAGWDKIRNGIFAGESGGDYDALFGFQNRAGGKFADVKLTDMTVDQALAFSDPSGPYGQWVKGEIGRVATPMGAYQIVGDTLRAAKRGLGLRGDELMTPQLQEKLGQWIYREQGTGAWTGYKGPRDTFAAAPDGAPVQPYRTRQGYTGEGQVAIGESTRVNVTYEVVDASTLQRASGDLQPRDRTRAASDAWIADTAARLDPAQLMPAPTADRGAPLVGPDNIIESGNGRVAAIERAYAMHPDRAAAYRGTIEAAGYKIPDGVDRPVLIARRTTELSPEARRQAVIDAQDSGVAQMTPTEVARAAAKQMTPEVLGRMDPAKPFTDTANADFLRRALDTLPRSARNAMFADSGALNSFGEMQMKQALFARAWPDPAIIARYAETGAGDLRGLLDALEAAAPQWAALRADIEAGRVSPEMDISGFVMDAMRMIAAARDIADSEGIPVSAALADLVDQVDMEFGAVAPLTEALITKFWTGDKAAPKAQIASFLSRYAEEARKTGGRGDMLAASPRDVLVAIDKRTFGAIPADLGAARPIPQPRAIRTDYPQEGSYKGAMSAEVEQADAVLQEDLAQGLQAPAPATADAALVSIEAVRGPVLIDRTAMAPAEGKKLDLALKAKQPHRDAESLMAGAAVNHAALNDAAAEMARTLGIPFKAAPLKVLARVLEKVTGKYKGDFRGIADVARTGVTTATPAQADAFVAALAKRFTLIDEGWSATPEGYFDRKLMVRFEDGQLGDLQIWPPGMHAAKAARGHDLYKIARDASLPGDTRAAAVAEMRVLYGKVSDQLDAGFAEKLGIGALRQDNASAASAADNSLARSSPYTSSAMAREPSSGTQALSYDQNLATPPSSAHRSPPSSKNLMGDVPSASDISNMGADGPNVNPVKPIYADRAALSQTRATWGDLTIAVGENDSVLVRDLLNVIDEDMKLAEVVAACNPKGGA